MKGRKVGASFFSLMETAILLSVRNLKSSFAFSDLESKVEGLGFRASSHFP